MSRLGPLLIALLTVGCGKNPVVIPPPPEDSTAGLGLEDVRPEAQRTEGRGYPERLSAGRWRVVRDDVEVRVNFAGTYNRFVISLTVLNRSKEKSLLFADWSEPNQVTLRGDDGKTYPLLPTPAGRAQNLREGGAGEPDPGYAYGAGPVVHNRGRVATLEFDPAAAGAAHLDLDLAGAPVGFADPILFRIPRAMLTEAGLGGVP
jgi:hypothetical protein